MNEPLSAENAKQSRHSVEDVPRPSFASSWVGRSCLYFTGSIQGRYLAAFAFLLIVALAMRLWELGGRTMHYDEAIHLYYSWRLSNLEGFIHSPWMHGPFQIEVVALFLRLLGDTDVAARLAYVLFGTVLVGMPYFLRDQLGRAGALMTGLMLAVSPSLLYFSRFGRNDIIMAFLAISLFILLWRYIHNPRNRYLFLASAALALAFASKETAYIITLIFGALALLLAFPFAELPKKLSFLSKAGRLNRASKNVAEAPGEQFEASPGSPASMRRLAGNFQRGFEYCKENPAIGFLTLLLTLTLPQWSAGVELAREIGASIAASLFGEASAKALKEGFGLTLVGRTEVSQGIVGAPVWDSPFVQLPISDLPVWLPGLFVFLVISLCILAGWRFSKSWRLRAAAVCIPVATAYAAALWLATPIGSGLDAAIAIGLGILCFAGFIYLRIPWRQSFFLLLVPSLSTLVYCLLFLPVLKVDSVLIDILPEGIQVASSGNAVPLNFLVAGGILLATGTISVALGLVWRGGTWLICAAIFYLIWATLFTTFFTNLAGLFSGVWQGMGYWIAQQEVARGNQPWYYYFVGLSVYEFLPVIFGTVGAIVFIRRRDRFGMALAFWAGVNFLAYTVASEKMPWLLVNITLPFIFLAGKLLGELAQRISWEQLFAPSRAVRTLALLLFPAASVCGAAYFFLNLANSDWTFSIAGALALVVSLGLVLVAAWAVRRFTGGHGSALAGLGIAAFLLGFTVWTSIKAAYTYDDSRLEILVYAQGSVDLRDSFRELDKDLTSSVEGSRSSFPVQVDYDVWYPFQWYARHHEKEGQLRFACFRDEGGAGGCEALESDPQASALLLAAHNRGTEPGALSAYSQDGPRRNLLWFPETYRRPGEDRLTESFPEEVAKDIKFFGEAATSADKWSQALNYVIDRRMDSDWFNSEYYTFLRQDQDGQSTVN